MKFTTRIGLTAALLSAAAGLWLVLASHSPEPVLPPASTSARTTGAGAQTPLSPTHATRSIEEAARLFELGVAGDLSLDMHTRSALDLLLATLGPNPSADDLQRLEDALRRSMPGAAATQAMALVRRYEAYHRAATADSATHQAPTTPAELQALLDKTMALRRQHFDEATARALFGAEEEQTRTDMAVNALQADTRLSALERATQIQALRERSPRDLPGLHAPEPAALGEMETQVAALRQQGGTPAQIEQLRRRYVGDENARALAESEALRDSWAARYQAFAQQKQAILASGAPDAAAQLEAALRQHFKDDELVAARAYDRTRTP